MQWLSRPWSREAGDQLSLARLELLAPALLGRADPDRVLRDVRDRAVAGKRPAPAPARGRGLPPEGQASARVQRRVHERRVPVVRRTGAARGGHDGHLRRLVLVLPALLRPTQRARAVRAAARRRVDADRPVHRRHRPREGSPALFALLRQGDERLGDGRLPRAVPAAVPPGLGAARRQEDVEVAGRCVPRRVGRPVRRRSDPHLHPLPGAGRSGHRLDARRDRSDGAIRAPVLARRVRRRGAAGVAGASTRRSRARRTRRSRGSPTTSSGGSSSTRRSRR